MRLAPLLVLLALAPALHAQGTPDPTPPEAYYPLHVGDQWEYREYEPVITSGFYRFGRRTVTRDTVVAGRRYFFVREQWFRPQGGNTWYVSDRTRVLRFDTTAANVKELSNGGASDQDVLLCRLDLPIPAVAGMVSCGGNELFTYGVAPGSVVAIGADVLTTSVRGINVWHFTESFAAGIGSVGVIGCEGSCSDLRLEYARVDGVEYGQKIVGLPNEPDPTPPADYYPLEVGNEWIYSESTVLFHGYSRRRIVREETVGTTTYAVEEFCSYDLQATAPAWACGTERLVRFDPATTSVLAVSDGSEFVLYCRLGADFGAEVSCGGSPEDGYVDRGVGPVRIGGVDYPVARLKGIRTLADPPPPPFAAGIGPLEPQLFGDVGQTAFEYARVRGVEYGVRPVAGEAGAAPTGALSLTVSPNPAAGPLMLALTLPEAQTVAVEAFDALGRRVWQRTAALGAGSQTVPVDASAWAPGVYVVRATAGRATATARVVRR